MRLAGAIPVEILEVIASADHPEWPTINQPRRAPANLRYDEHMKELVPSIPARLRRA